jgi:hypothetical protein
MKQIFVAFAAMAVLSLHGAPVHAQGFREIMEDIGVAKRKKEKMDFSERAPLVVPPQLDALPPPEEGGALAAVNPNWPVDPDAVREEEEAKRKKESQVEQRAYMRNPSGQIYDIRAREREEGVYNDPDKTRTYDANVDTGRMSPDELKAAKKRREAAGLAPGQAPVQAYVEPERKRLTDPPAGYRAPSPAQPYGPPGEKKDKKTSIFSKLNPFN